MRNLLSDLRQHPLILGIVLVNVLFLWMVIREVGESGKRRDAIIAELTRDCAINPAPKGDRQ
jgi:hypothetical protein